MISLYESSGLWARNYRVPLRSVAVAAVIQANHAAVVLRQRFVNGEKRPIEAVYIMPLPAGAALTRLAVEAGGRRLDGEVRPRDEAFRAYDEALAAGHGAALLEQERDEVATVTVGNVLPGEEVLVEVEFVEPLQSDEGALRWRLPTRVAPRYIPGESAGVRSGHGAVAQTDRVPDADRISPPESFGVETTLELDLLIDLGARVIVESPSHRLRVADAGARATRVSLAGRAPLDRDLVVLAQIEGAQGTRGVAAAVTAHREGDEPGTFALTLVPDLAAREPVGPKRVVLVLDVSGSMEGPSLAQAVAAARLCLRHLRPGDLFSLLAFNEEVLRFEGRGLHMLDDASLRRADRWLARLEAGGGTELQAPLVEALCAVHGGVVVLLTDGQVADEGAIFRAARATGSEARVYGFGVGTNVCEGLLRDLARASGGAVELIYPGEAIDKKVVAQFARATAPRIDAIEMIVDGVRVDELVPERLPPLVDGEPWSVLGRYASPGQGRGLLTGLLDGAPFELEFTLDAPARAERPVLPRLWARGRIRDIELSEASAERPAEAQAQIVALATRYGLASRHTSLVVIERRQGERLSPALPAPRVVQVQAAPGRGAPVYLALDRRGPVIPGSHRHFSPASGPFFRVFRSGQSAYGAVHDESSMMDSMDLERERGITITPRPPVEPEGEEVGVLQGQGASGLWGGEGAEAQLEATARALWKLARLGVTAGHALHGAPIRRAIEALIEALAQAPAPLAEAALAAAWLAASGRRSRGAVRQAAEALAGSALASELDDDEALRRRLQAWSGEGLHAGGWREREREGSGRGGGLAPPGPPLAAGTACGWQGGFVDSPCTSLISRGGFPGSYDVAKVVRRREGSRRRRRLGTPYSLGRP